MKLKYIGGGFLPGVPARDLTAEEVADYGGAQMLIASGLYAAEETKAPADKKPGTGGE